MKFNSLVAAVCVLFTSNCAITALFDGSARYGTEKRSMWAIQSDVDDGTVTPVSTLPTNGHADFAGHFAVFDNATGDQELLFGDVAMRYDFTAASNQLTGKLNDIRLVDEKGNRIYGIPTPKILTSFSGSVNISGTYDGDSVPVSGSGNLVDGDGTGFAMTFAADPEFYQQSNGDYVLSSAWATGTLTESGQPVRSFDSGYMGARE